MSSVAKVATVTFPNQQAIVDYLSKHPCKPSIDLQSDSLQKVATYFAGKQMSLDAIKGNVETALADANLAQKKLADLGTSLQALVAACEKIDKASETPDTSLELYRIC